MRRFPLAVALTSILTAVPLAAQGASSCGTTSADACQKAADIFSYLIPQFGGALAGGNPVLGSGDVLGGFGHVSLGVRASAVRGSLPQFDSIQVRTTGAVASELSVAPQWVPAPVADAAIGLWRGWEVGVTRLGGVDALVSATYLPNVESDDASFDLPDGNLKLGFGARVGVLQEAIIVPAVSFTYLQRGLPTFSISGETPDGAVLAAREMAIDVSSWRVMATKSLAILTLSVGFGSDVIEADGALRARAPGVPIAQTLPLAQSITRSVWFADASLRLGPAVLTVETGSTSGGDLTTVNRFVPAPNAARRFVSVGTRIGL